MTSNLKRLLTILVVLTVVYAGYYLYTNRNSADLSGNTSTAEYEMMLNRTQVFISHRQELESLDLDLSLFEDSRFRSLRSHRVPLANIESGRSNPFAETGSTN